MYASATNITFINNTISNSESPNYGGYFIKKIIK